MVRINLVNPKVLSDNHLVAEYNEILKLFGYVKKYPDQVGIPEEFTLGIGHIKFFKNKLGYLYTRFILLSKEMNNRGFKTDTSKITYIMKLQSDQKLKGLWNDWIPKDKDLEIIKIRILQRIEEKPNIYRYKGKYHSVEYFKKLLQTQIGGGKHN